MWICFILILMGSGSFVYADNPYQLGVVNYFPEQRIKDATKQDEVFEWNEPILSQDGQVSAYTPPMPMLRLLENPTEENAKVYLSWQRLKVKKIIQAQRVIDQLVKEEEAV